MNIKIVESSSDINVIPDKFNTGPQNNPTLTKINSAGIIDGVEYVLGSGGTLVGPNFAYSATNLALPNPVIIQNKDFSDLGFSFLSSADIPSERIVQFVNCKFLTATTGPTAVNLTVTFTNCEHIRTATVRDSTFDRCHFYGDVYDGINPIMNVTANDCYFSDLAHELPEGTTNTLRHSDGTQIFGITGIDAENIIFNRCRFEVPNIKWSINDDEELNNEVYVNSAISVALEYSNGDEIHFYDCIVNGGGYTVYFGVVNGYTLTNSSIEDLKVGCSHQWGDRYDVNNPIDPEIAFVNWSDTSRLYVSSRSGDGNDFSFVVSNDTNEERELTIVTDKGDFTFTVPKCLLASEFVIDQTAWEDFPFDIELSIEGQDISYAIGYDTTGGMPVNPNDHILFVNFTEEDVFIEVQNLTPQFNGKVRADKIECIADGTPTVGGAYLKSYDSPAIYRESQADALTTNKSFDFTDPTALVANVVAKSTYTTTQNDSDVRFTNSDCTEQALYETAQTGSILTKILAYFGI